MCRVLEEKKEFKVKNFKMKRAIKRIPYSIKKSDAQPCEIYPKGLTKKE